jgi:hypothetical protein
MEWNNVKDDGNPGYYWQMLEAMAQHYHIDMNKPFKDLSAEHRELVLHGTKGEKVRLHYHNRDGRQATFDTAFEGVIGNLERRYRETNSEYIREKISEYMSDRPCPTCQGKRLRPEALAVTVNGVNILQITEWPVLRSLEWAKELTGPKTRLTSRQQAISDRILKEIVSRLGFLVNVGLEYLTLHRSAGSRRSARGWWACCTCWTSRPSDCTRATTTACSPHSKGCATLATLCWSSSTTTTPSAPPTGSLTWAPARAHTAVTSSPRVPLNKSSPIPSR